jgi:general secretion pathway protein D
VDVLSTPYLLTTDNQEAEMSVGDKIPVIRGASQVGGGLGAGLGISHNIQHEDVKLTFKVTPHVGADDNVRLDIMQEVNELGPKFTILTQEQYSIRTKSAKTQLVLKDQQTGVIGGLISHSALKTDNKVPFLGDIPIIGNLFFKNTKQNNRRRSLLLIITPYIIRTEEDYKKIIDRKFKEREEFARLYYGGKIRNYNPHIDYDKKKGPLTSLISAVDEEMKKSENGGPGDGSEVIIKPKETEPGKNIETVPNINLPSPEGDQTTIYSPTDFNDGTTLGGDLREFSMPEPGEMNLVDDFDESGE